MRQTNKRSQSEKVTKAKILLIALLAILAIILIILLLNRKAKTINNQEQIAQSNYTTNVFGVEYDITQAVTEKPNIPVIAAGMIPVKYDGTAWVITTADDTSWYNYAEGKPAYMMLNDGKYQSELQVDMTGKALASENKGAQINQVGTIYAWVPRYAYTDSGESLYIKQGYTVAGSYTISDIFTYSKTDWDRDFSLSGVWIERIPLANTSAVTTKVNNMNKEESIYTFMANTIAENANTNTEGYTTAMRKFNINSPTNANRTVLKVVNDKMIDSIKATAIFDTDTQKVNINVTYSNNGISKIIDQNGKVLSENSNTADSGDAKFENGKIYKYIIIDALGNQKQIAITVTGVKKPITAKATFNTSTQKITITVTEHKYDIAKIIDEDGNVLSTNSTTANTGDTPIGNLTYKFTVIDVNENQEVVTITVSGSTSDYYFITNETQLKEFRNKVNNGSRNIKAYQTKDIVWTGGYWTPIGGVPSTNSTSKSYAFYGVYDGGGHTISGLKISESYNTGFIGVLGYGLTSSSDYAQGTVKNLGIINSTISGSALYTGAIVGYANYGTIENCWVSSSTVSSSNSSGNVRWYLWTKLYYYKKLL